MKGEIEDLKLFVYVDTRVVLSTLMELLVNMINTAISIPSPPH